MNGLRLGLGPENRYQAGTDKNMAVPGYSKKILNFGTAYRFLDALVKKIIIRKKKVFPLRRTITVQIKASS